MYLMKYLPWEHKREWMKYPVTSIWKKKIIGSVSWEQPQIMIFGRSHIVPRYTAFLGDKNVKYKYSGVENVANGWPIWFLPLLQDVNSFSNTDFNGCLLNLYRSGIDKMGWHSDNEPEIDQKSDIFSLSLGSTRDFAFKNRISGHRFDLNLCDGDLLIMRAGCQEEWVHSLPVRKRVKGSRINLTFRRFVD